MMQTCFGYWIVGQFKHFKHYDNLGIQMQLKRCVATGIGATMMFILFSIFFLATGMEDLYFIYRISMAIAYWVFMYFDVPYVVKILQSGNYLKNNWKKQYVYIRSRTNSRSKLQQGISSQSTTPRATTPRACAVSNLGVTNTDNDNDDNNLGQNHNHNHNHNHDNCNGNQNNSDTTMDEMKISNMRNWSDIVSTPFGYQLFINHCESEFNVENLLFLTEYVQVKDVLWRKFFDAMNQINGNNKHDHNFDQIATDIAGIRKSIGNPRQHVQVDYTLEHKVQHKQNDFHVNFPKIDDSMLRDESIQDNNDNNFNRVKSMSLSFRARNINIINLYDSQEYQYPVSLIAKKLFNNLDIIDAFITLYTKYIDTNQASFMINISSRTRQRLTVMLDCKYYNRYRLQRDKEKQRKNSRKWSKASMSNQNSNSIKINTGDEKESDNKTESQQVAHQNISVGGQFVLIKEQFEQENKSIEWLLAELIGAMDIAATEISVLLNDTFNRFKRASISL